LETVFLLAFEIYDPAPADFSEGAFDLGYIQKSINND
jgi:hypothetical protein